MSDIKQNQWKVFGRCCDPNPKKNNDLAASMDGPILIEEEPSHLGWTYVQRIRPTASSTTANDTFGKPIEAQLAINLIKNGVESFTDKAFTNAELLDAIVKLNYGITFDKSLVLKILGQPNCEGLRSYLCHRGKNADGSPHYTLILVGVDINGYDLNYYPLADDKRLDGAKLVTESLIAEYGHPPDGTKEVLIGKPPYDEHYVLLNYL